jgi:hypothetical protein
MLQPSAQLDGCSPSPVSLQWMMVLPSQRRNAPGVQANPSGVPSISDASSGASTGASAASALGPPLR